MISTGIRIIVEIRLDLYCCCPYKSKWTSVLLKPIEKQTDSRMVELFKTVTKLRKESKPNPGLESAIKQSMII